MHALVNFANHGLLPFVGRHTELGRLRSFCTGTTDTLRAALTVGEAGSGKSRLFDELLNQCEGQGLVVLRTRLHPGAGVSVVQLVARALRNRSDLRLLLPGNLDATLFDVVAGLERLARLRQTVLVVEDVHLLEGDGLREFALLLDALGDEPLALLLSTRPLEPRVRGVIEPRLTLELPLSGLTNQTIADLWVQLFSERDNRVEVEQLAELTAGNALAVRSALRAALRMEESHEERGEVQIVLDRDRFAMMIGESVRVLSEGIAAHLAPEERAAAERIAALGEVFSTNAAERLLGGSEMLDRLVYRGVIATAVGAIAPLRPGIEGRPPQAFTHSLLHRHLVERGAHDPHMLIDVIADTTLPIYTITPWLTLERSLPALSLGCPERMEQTFKAAAESWRIMSDLQPTPNWHLGVRIGQVVDRLSRHPELQPPERTLALRLDLTRSRLLAWFRSDESEEFNALSHSYMAMTAELPPRLLHHRVSALALRARHLYETAPEQVAAEEERIDRLVAEHPELRPTSHYLMAISDRANRAMANGDDESLRSTEQIVDAIAAEYPEDRELQNLILGNHRFPYLNTYNTPEELEKRFRQATKLRTLAAGNPKFLQRLLLHEVVLHRDAGMPDDLERLADEADRLYRDHGVPTNRASVMHCRFCTRALRAVPLETVANEMLQTFESYPQGFRSANATHLSYAVMEMGLIVGDLAWSRATIERIAPLPQEWMVVPMYVLIALEDGGSSAQIASDPLLTAQWRALAGGPIDEVHAAFRGLFPSFLGVIQRIMELRAAIGLLRLRGSAVVENAQVQTLVREQLRATLEWLEKRGYAPSIEALLRDEGGFWLHAAEREDWNERARAIRRAATRQARAAETRRDERFRLTMLERIELHDPEGATVPIRGGRMKAVLGLLVAARVSRHAPDKQEFYMLAAGDEGKEFELARKTVNMAISSLRKTLGDDAFLREEDAIHLNLDRVTVDLLEVWERIAEAGRALKGRSFARARTAALSALERGAGKVAFPSLYDSYFEAAREDFEARLRATAITVGRALLAEGDAAGAEEVLRRGFAWLPDDEEIGELLTDALRADDHRAEAELVRLRTRIEAV